MRTFVWQEISERQNRVSYKNTLSANHFNCITTTTLQHAIANSRCISHFLYFNQWCHNIQPAGGNPVSVVFPDVIKITSSHNSLLPFTHIPQESRKCNIFKELKKMLLSIVQLCYSNMNETFIEKKIYIHKEE